MNAPTHASPHAATLTPLSGTRLLRRAHLLGDFLAVAEAGAIRAAAERLHISQSALTRRIQDLERELGVTLFERSPSGMAPTAFGHALLHHARLIGLNCTYAAGELQDLLDGGAGELRIAAGPAWAYVAAPNAIAAVQRELPGVRIEFLNRLNEATLPMLQAGQLDAVLGGLPPLPARDPQLVYEPLIDVDFRIFAGGDHPLQAQTEITPALVRSEPWVWFNEAVTGRSHLEAWFQADGLTPPLSSVETSSMLVAFRLMQQGRYLMLLPMTLRTLAAEHGMAPLALPAGLGRYVSGLMYRPSALRLRVFFEFRAQLLREAAAVAA